MTSTESTRVRTAAAVESRRRDSRAALARVDTAIAHLHRKRIPVSVAAIARHARVSRTFLYTQPDAKAAIASAKQQPTQANNAIAVDDPREAAWRERALNAETALKAANAEILAHRTQIGTLLGRIRDLEAEWTEETLHRITTENTTLKQRVRQLTADNRDLDEKLTAARSNLRFQDRRVADLEARLAEHATIR